MKNKAHSFSFVSGVNRRDFFYIAAAAAVLPLTLPAFA